MNNTVKDRVYIVTGGSRGFGLEIAKLLVEQGAKVGLMSRNQVSLDQALAEIGTDHAFGVPGDVGSKEAVHAAFESIKKHFGRLDGLVNNAGLARPNSIENLVEEEVLMQVNANFIGTVFCSQAAIPLLRDGDNPRIVNISSACAWHYDEMSYLSIYAATKAAVERFSRDLRLEVQKDGIGVTCVRPGGAITSFADEWDTEVLGAALEEWKNVGTYMDMGMDTTHVAQAVCYALCQPLGVAVDLLEIRPNVPTSKSIF